MEKGGNGNQPKESENIDPKRSVVTKTAVLRKTKGRVFKCKKCPITYPDRNHLMKHLADRHNCRLFQCPSCPKMYGKSNYVLRHMKTSHPHDNKYLLFQKKDTTCTQCDLTFETYSQLLTHKRSTHNLRTAKCDLCTKEFLNLTNMKRHRMSHDTTDNPVNVTDRRTLGRHRKLVNRQNKISDKAVEKTKEKKGDHHVKRSEETDRVEKTGENDKAVEMVDKLSEMELIKMTNGNPPEESENQIVVTQKPEVTKSSDIKVKMVFKCTHCSFTDLDRNVFLKHSADCHNTKVYKCPKCPNLYKDSSGMISHARKYHPDDQSCSLLKKKNTKCTDCELEFPTFFLMWLHKKKDHKEKLFKCDICDSYYVNRASMLRHQKEFHGLVDMSVNKKKTQISQLTGTAEEEEQYPVLVDATDTTGYSKSKTIPTQAYQDMLETLNQQKNQEKLKYKQDSSFFLHLGRYDPSSI